MLTKEDYIIECHKLTEKNKLLTEALEKMVKVFEPYAKEAQYVSGLYMVKQLIKP